MTRPKGIPNTFKAVVPNIQERKPFVRVEKRGKCEHRDYAYTVHVCNTPTYLQDNYTGEYLCVAHINQRRRSKVRRI